MVNAAAVTKPSAAAGTVKFLCSYGGKILPRHPDGKLRYHGGHTRLLSVNRSISSSELSVKMGDLCGSEEVTLRCQLPTEDLDALVSIKSDEDLRNLIEEYDLAASQTLKIRAFLFVPRSSPSPKSVPPNGSRSALAGSVKPPLPGVRHRCVHQVPMTMPVAMPPIWYVKSAGKVAHRVSRNPGHVCLVHHGNHLL